MTVDLTKAFTLQVEGLEQRIVVDSFEMRQCLEPPTHTWTITVDHEAISQVVALPEHKRWYWLRRFDDTMVVSGQAMIGWDGIEASGWLHFTIHGDAYAEEDEPAAPRRKRAGARA